MESPQNFFALISTTKYQETASREIEPLSTDTADFLRQFNQNAIPLFIYDIFISKFIHFLNLKPNFQNRGRVLLTNQTKADYSESMILAILKLYFNREDADSSFLFLSGHGNKNGQFILNLNEGEAFLEFAKVKELWEQRTSKGKNRELFILIDASYSGKWVLDNNSPEIFLQSSCSEKETAKDFSVENNIIGSVFLHNFLMINGCADCFYEGALQTPMCTQVNLEQAERIRNILGMNYMKKGWQEFKSLFLIQVRSFTRDQIIFDGMVQEDIKVEEVKKKGPDVKRWGFSAE